MEKEDICELKEGEKWELSELVSDFCLADINALAGEPSEVMEEFLGDPFDGVTCPFIFDPDARKVKDFFVLPINPLAPFRDQAAKQKDPAERRAGKACITRAKKWMCTRCKDVGHQV